jgi:hypothetical protein
MENPLNGMEIFVGLFTGTLGFATADVLDRLVTMRERKDDKGQALAMRFIEAPLLDDFFPRVGVGVAVAAVPLVAAQFIASPMGRSALQTFGFGAAFRLLGKAVDDVAAYLFKDSAVDSTGKKLFSGEIGQRTAVGLSGAPCPNCGNKAGLGACACRSMLPQYGGTNLPIQPSPVSSTIPPGGGGYPPVVNQGTPPVFMPPNNPLVPVTPQVPPPAISRGPGPAVPTTPSPTPPPSSMFAPNLLQPKLNGLGDVSAAQEVLRTHGPAYVALRKNRGALHAAANGTATPAQRQTADSIVSQHRSSFATLQQFHPTVLDTAARGLGMLADESQPSTFPGTSRHRDHAAE